jgi:hypothetical protein
MLQFSARGFYWTSQYLENLKIDCYMLSLPVDGDTPILNMTTHIDERLKKKCLQMLEQAETQFRAIDLTISADTVGDIRKRIEKNILGCNCQWLVDQITNLQKLVERETKGKVFLYVTPERAKFFPNGDNPQAFGSDVAGAFPSAVYDVHESALCLALARPTASVFHLMKTLEYGLAALGDQFGVSLEHTNWAPALGEIESKIREMHKDAIWKSMPDCKLIQEKFAQAASTFGVFKDAWRNYTMHKRGKYTEEEAELLFNNVKSFMQKITALGLKEPA